LHDRAVSGGAPDEAEGPESPDVQARLACTFVCLELQASRALFDARVMRPTGRFVKD